MLQLHVALFACNCEKMIENEQKKTNFKNKLSAHTRKSDQSNGVDSLKRIQIQVHAYVSK